MSDADGYKDGTTVRSGYVPSNSRRSNWCISDRRVLKLLTQWFVNEFKYDATGNLPQMSEAESSAFIPTHKPLRPSAAKTMAIPLRRLTAVSAACYKRKGGLRLKTAGSRFTSGSPDNDCMAEITLRVLDGADRGKTFDALPTPVTIGREEGNSIQLNDERVSRFHLKIQTDRDKVVLTDLQSTNGTKVNGEDIQLRILRFGDLITVGRSTLLFGSREQIAGRLRELRPKSTDKPGTATHPEGDGDPPGFEVDSDWENDPELQSTLHTLRPPALPDGLSPGQAAEVSEIIEYVHLRLRGLIESATVKTPKDAVTLDYEPWQNLIDLQSLLAEYLRQIGEPGETMG
jgi:hypothetical protein